MAKVLITPKSNVEPFVLEGDLTIRAFPEDGKIYYIAGRSFPEEIVTILDLEATP